MDNTEHRTLNNGIKKLCLKSQISWASVVQPLVDYLFRSQAPHPYAKVVMIILLFTMRLFCVICAQINMLFNRSHEMVTNESYPHRAFGREYFVQV